MPESTKLWIVEDGDKLSEIKPSKLDLEERIQKWVEKDISIISNDLLVIGYEVETAYGKFIDILCLDRQGDVVIVELKRNLTPREVTAQTLDYASWVQELSHTEISAIAENYYKDSEGLEKAFQTRFGDALPEILNSKHRMLIIGSTIDDSTERIINYLSEHYGVGINAITFGFYQHDGRQYLSRNFLIQEEEAAVQQARNTRSKRKPPLSLEEFRTRLESENLRNLFNYAVEKLSEVFDGRSTTQSTISFVGLMEGSRNTIFVLQPLESSEERGLLFYFYRERFLSFFQVEEAELNEIFSLQLESTSIWNVENSANSGSFTSNAQIDGVIKKLQMKRSK